MADETVTTSGPNEPTPTAHTTIIREGSSGSGMGIFLAVIPLIAIIGGIYIFNRNSASEDTRNNAVAEAARNVGNAATKAGNAAENAANNTADNAQPQK